jgi:hypothetical protein
MPANSGRPVGDPIVVVVVDVVVVEVVVDVVVEMVVEVVDGGALVVEAGVALGDDEQPAVMSSDTASRPMGVRRIGQS